MPDTDEDTIQGGEEGQDTVVANENETDSGGGAEEPVLDPVRHCGGNRIGDDADIRFPAYLL